VGNASGGHAGVGGGGHWRCQPGASIGGELELERELRTKAMYYLVCFLI
jgi:hypothetical protein